MTRTTCNLAPRNWLCLRDPGHDGPCAAAPLTGTGACPDIARCVANGCRSKCGPDEGAQGGSGWEFWVALAIVCIFAVVTH